MPIPDYEGKRGVVPVGSIGDREDVGRNFVSFLALVELNDLLGVDRKTNVRVDDDAEETGVSLKEIESSGLILAVFLIRTPIQTTCPGTA
jgi:hypothetical protein